MTYSLDQLKEMIPIYLNGNLSGKDRTAFDEGLKRFPELEKELSEFAEIKESYTVVEDTVPLNSDALFARIQDNIQEEQAQTPAFQIKAWLRQLGQLLADWYRTPALSWSLAGLQFAALLVVITLVVPETQQYGTYTASQSQKDGIRINVVFNQEAKEIDIRNLLQQVGATIVDGPTPSGLYVIKVDASGDVKSLIEKLNQSGIVRLAKKALSCLEGAQPAGASQASPMHGLTTWCKRAARYAIVLT